MKVTSNVKNWWYSLLAMLLCPLSSCLSPLSNLPTLPIYKWYKNVNSPPKTKNFTNWSTIKTKNIYTIKWAGRAQMEQPNDTYDLRGFQNQLSILRFESACFGILAPFILALASANILCCSANASSSVISAPLHFPHLGESCSNAIPQGICTSVTSRSKDTFGFVSVMEPFLKKKCWWFSEGMWVCR